MAPGPACAAPSLSPNGSAPSPRPPIWRDWFAGLGVQPPHSRAGLTVPDYDAAIDAALMGQGVALGWEHLAAGKITQGALQWIGTDRIETGQSIYLVEQAGRAEAAHLARFRSWITAPFAA